MKFLIEAKYNPIEYNGAAIVFTSGKPPFINVNDQLIHHEYVQGKWTFRTGLQPRDISSNPVLTETEKKIYLETQERLLPKIKEAYGEESLASDNQVFWNPERTNLKITSDNLQFIYDTEDPDSAILYLNILGGGFPSVAPSKAISDRVRGYNFYLTTEDEAATKEVTDSFGNKAEAYDALTDLLVESGNDALVYISYLLTDLTKGYSKNTSRATIKRDFINYIENGVNGKDKKRSVNKFYELALQWKADKDTLIAKALIQAAIYHGKIKKSKETKKYEYKGIELGTTPKNIYDVFMKPANQADFDELITEVEKKLNN